MNDDIVMTRGNKKLPTSTLNFSLPPVQTCPNATDECKKFCYAKKAWKQYPNVRNAWTQNLKMTKSDYFEAYVKAKINRSKTVKQIRTHTSGDFYSQSYLDKWINIAKDCRDKIFYAYTKSLHLNFTKKPDNFIIIASDDKGEYSDSELLFMNLNGRSKVEEKGYVAKPGEFVCPGDCKVCNECYTKADGYKKIVFERH